MRRILILAFVAFNLAGATVALCQMATTDLPPRAPSANEGGYYEMLSGDYVPTDDDLGAAEASN